MRIGELARAVGVSVRSLRYYEQHGLLEPVRSAGGHRAYRPADVDQVRRVRILLAAGIPVATIAELLPCMDERDGTLASGCPELTDELLAERARISAALGDLHAARDALDAVLAASGVVPPGDRAPAGPARAAPVTGTGARALARRRTATSDRTGVT